MRRPRNTQSLRREDSRMHPSVLLSSKCKSARLHMKIAYTTRSLLFLLKTMTEGTDIEMQISMLNLLQQLIKASLKLRNSLMLIVSIRKSHKMLKTHT